MIKKIFLYKYLFIIFVLCSFFLSFVKKSLAVPPHSPSCVNSTFPRCDGTCSAGNCNADYDTDSCHCVVSTPTDGFVAGQSHLIFQENHQK